MHRGLSKEFETFASQALQMRKASADVGMTQNFPQKAETGGHVLDSAATLSSQG
jgi:hypothetical protein